MMFGFDLAAVFFQILMLFVYLVPAIFIVWFLLKFLKIQQEKNIILKELAEKIGDSKLRNE